MKNDNTIKHRIITKQPRVTTVAYPQTISFRKIKRKQREKTPAQAHIETLSLQVAELVIENEKSKKTTR